MGFERSSGLALHPANSHGPMGGRNDTDRFEWERQLLEQGVDWIAGVDEAGRGPLAGPVVAAAAMFSAGTIREGLPPELEGLNDSKQLSAKARASFHALLEDGRFVHFAIASVAADVIDQMNILRATHRAMAEALRGLRPAASHALVDGLAAYGLPCPQTPLVKGDARSFSIAAASVLAKVTRDRCMEEYDRVYPVYGFAKHKGYGTPDHLAALAKHGPCPIHRRSFAPLKPVQGELFCSSCD